MNATNRACFLCILIRAWLLNLKLFKNSLCHLLMNAAFNVSLAVICHLPVFWANCHTGIAANAFPAFMSDFKGHLAVKKQVVYKCNSIIVDHTPLPFLIFFSNNSLIFSAS